MTIISGISVSDADTANLTVKLEALHGSISVPASSAVTITGNGSASVTLQGHQDDINILLASVDYEFDAEYVGNDQITITAFDGSLNDVKIVEIIALLSASLSGTCSLMFTVTTYSEFYFLTSQVPVFFRHTPLYPVTLSARE